MVLIRDLFERDPTRPIRQVASVRERDPNVVFDELDEYVVTPYIERDLTDILDLFIESHKGPVEDVCCWITGFFGSGKSIFLKLLGYILGNLELKLRTGERIEAGRFFLNKHGLKAYAPMLYKELKTIPLFINLQDLDVAKDPSVTRIVYTELLRVSGLSKIPWIAEIERTIQQKGLKRKFEEKVIKIEGRNWSEAKEVVVRARPILSRALSELDPESYPTREDALKSIEDVEKNLEITPSYLVQRLIEKAKELDPDNGRIVILLDEAGQYLDRPERLGDLNVLAEEISKVGRGRIWLFVTAQESLEDVLSRVPHTPDIARIRDRFQKHVQLTPENIDTVTKKRMLEKKADPKFMEILREVYKKNEGALWASATLKGVKRDYGPLFERQESMFIESYPFMPYHIRLMQEIFNILRSKGAMITSRERTVLAAVSTIMTGINDRRGLASLPVGFLTTFDSVYDVVEESLKAISSSEEAAIEQISRLGKQREIEVSSVAKVLFLLQNIEWIPCTVENIAALLYPNLGADVSVIEAGVKGSLDVLVGGLWADERQGTYRLLSEFERSFEKLVREKSSDEDIPAKKRQWSHDIMVRLLKDQWKLNKFVYKGVPFEVYVTADDKDVSAKGYIDLRVFSPLQTQDNESIQRLKRESLLEPKTTYWLCAPEESYDRMLEKAICIDKVLGEFKPLSQADKLIVEEQRAGLHILKEDELPRVFESSLANGRLICQSDENLLDGKRNIQEIFKIYVEKSIRAVFPEFELAPFRLERDPEDIVAVLKWRGGSLPHVYTNLKLIDEHNQILTDRPAASRVFEYLKSRKQSNDRRGASILEYFTSPPYGWDTGIIRLIFAALFRNGSISAILGGKPFDSANDSVSQEIYINTKTFGKTIFDIGGELVTPQQRDLALKLLSDIFGKKAGPRIDEIDEILTSEIETASRNCESLSSKAELINLPVLRKLKQVGIVLSEMKAETRDRRILNFVEYCKGEERIGELKSYLKILKRLKEFDFCEYQSIFTFGRDAAPQLLANLKSSKPEIATQIESLHDSLAAEDFLDRWTTIRGTFEKLKKSYEETYVNLHNMRHKLIQQAILDLKSQANLKELLAGKEAKYLRPLLELDCSETPRLNEGFTCGRCSSTIDRLSLHIGSIETQKSEIEAVLSKEQAKTTIQTPPPSFEETITKLPQVNHVIQRVQETTRKALALGNAVKVAVEVETNQPKSKE